MSKLHIQHTTSIVRWYDELDGYNTKAPYKAVCSISWIGDTQVLIHGMHGVITKQNMIDLFTELAALGATHVVAERKGAFVTKDIYSMLSKATKTCKEPQNI